MKFHPINGFEKVAYGFIAAIYIIGLSLYFINKSIFLDYWANEDGFIETSTVFILLATACSAALRARKCILSRRYAPLFICFLTVVLFTFGAGEEISWGQRLLKIESNDYFLKNNLQGETNLHNLSINGININKLLFSKVVSIGLLIYLLLIPYMYAKGGVIMQTADRIGLPIAKNHHILAFFFIALIQVIVSHGGGKFGEVYECAAVTMAFIVFTFPKNAKQLTTH